MGGWSATPLQGQLTNGTLGRPCRDSGPRFAHHLGWRVRGRPARPPGAGTGAATGLIGLSSGRRPGKRGWWKSAGSFADAVGGPWVQPEVCSFFSGDASFGLGTPCPRGRYLRSDCRGSPCPPSPGSSSHVAPHLWGSRGHTSGGHQGVRPQWHWAPAVTTAVLQDQVHRAGPKQPPGALCLPLGGWG